MDTLIHADIFFFVTTIAVVVVGLVFTIALIYFIKILGDIKEVTGQVREETVLFREDLGNLRSDIRREGFRLERLLSFFRTMLKWKNRGKTRSKSK
jgi:hypothetical protein